MNRSKEMKDILCGIEESWHFVIFARTISDCGDQFLNVNFVCLLAIFVTSASTKANTLEQTDEQYCTIISSSIAEVIRISTDDIFRRKCYEMLNASNTNECQIKIHEKLLEINKKSQKRRNESEIQTYHGGENKLTEGTTNKRMHTKSA